MKQAIDYDLKHFIDAIKRSEEYVQYQKVREKVRQEPDKERIIHEFRKRSYLLQIQKDGVDLFDEIDRLNQEFSYFRADPLMEEYLEAELGFCRLMQYVTREVMLQLDFDLGFAID